jgi:NADH-quinone oxidoreductase subunit C
MIDDVMLAAAGPAATLDRSFGVTTIDVPGEVWVGTAAAMRDHPEIRCRFFDWLSAYDDRGAGLAVVTHLWSVERRDGVLLRTHVAADGGHLGSLTSVYPGADWHERETFEMFGIVFDGHPRLVPLLLPDGFEGHPLRKDFVLASRVAKAWPGAKEPGESDRDLLDGGGNIPPRRRRMRPPGVPEPGSWGGP